MRSTLLSVAVPCLSGELWSLVTATIIRLVPAERVAMLTFAGTHFASRMLHRDRLYPTLRYLPLGRAVVTLAMMASGICSGLWRPRWSAGVH